MEVKYNLETKYTYFKVNSSNIKEELIKGIISSNNNIDISISEGDNEIIITINGRRMLWEEDLYTCFKVAKISTLIEKIIDKITEEDIINIIKEENKRRNKKLRRLKNEYRRI